MSEDAMNFVKQVEQLNIELIDFVTLNDFFNTLDIETKRELRREAYERKYEY